MSHPLMFKWMKRAWEGNCPESWDGPSTFARILFKGNGESRHVPVTNVWEMPFHLLSLEPSHLNHTVSSVESVVSAGTGDNLPHLTQVQATRYMILTVLSPEATCLRDPLFWASQSGNQESSRKTLAQSDCIVLTLGRIELSRDSVDDRRELPSPQRDRGAGA